MRNKNKIDQVIIDEISEFLIKEFLEYYPFNSYQFLLESLNGFNLGSTSFNYSVNMLEKSTLPNNIEIENTLWIATIRQRLIMKIHNLNLDRREFKEIVLNIKSSSYLKEKRITCNVNFIDSFSASYESKSIHKTIRKSKLKLKNSTLLLKIKRFFYL